MHGLHREEPFLTRHVMDTEEQGSTHTDFWQIYHKDFPRNEVG